MDNVTIDWSQRRMSGYARMAVGAGYFDVPLISNVTGNLWQGGCQQGYDLDPDFVKVVSLYPWEQYDLGPDTIRVEIKALDSNDGFDRDDLERASDEVLSGLEKGKTLVHCQAGLNRSGLVAGVALVKLGYTPEEALAILRSSRCDMVLCNQTFEQQLLNYPQE